MFVIVDTIGCLPCVCNCCNFTDSSPGYVCVGCCFHVQVVMIPKRRLKGTWSIMSPQFDQMDLVRPMISFPLWSSSVSKLFHCHGFLFMTMCIYAWNIFNFPNKMLCTYTCAHVSTNSVHQGPRQGMLEIQTTSRIASLPWRRLCWRWRAGKFHDLPTVHLLAVDVTCSHIPINSGVICQLYWSSLTDCTSCCKQ